jgi:hypothetical protein
MIVNGGWNAIMLGRFFPFQTAEIWTVFALLPNLTCYKLFVVSTVVANVILFAGFVWYVTRDADFAAIATFLMPGLFQFRAFYDPILSFAGVQQFIFGMILISLISLQRSLETGRRRWLAGSIVAYLIALLTYEATYPFFALHFLIIARYRRCWKGRLATTLPFAGVAGIFLLTTVVVRAL